MESPLILVFISTVLVTAILGQGVHLEFRGEVIPNNSVVSVYNISTSGATLRCVTQRVDCCSTADETRAEWFTPSGEVADTQFTQEWGGSGRERYVGMNRKESTIVQRGLYHCNIPALNNDITTLYVGIYISSFDGNPTITGITHNQLCPEMFTLTCISTVGPATTVTWTLNGSEITYDANHVLTQTVINTTTTEYNNTLTVTGREPGNYQCTVSNKKSSYAKQLLVVNFTGGASSCSSSQPPTQLSTTKPSTTITTVPNPSSSEIPTTSDTQNPSLSPEIPTSTTTSDTKNPSSPSHSTEKLRPTTTSDTPTLSSSSQLPVIAGAAAGLILCIILIAALVLTLVVYKRRKGTWPRGKKTQGPCSLQQIDDTRSFVNQNQTNPSTGQTLTAQTTDDAINYYHVVNTTSSPHSLPTIMDSIDPLYSAVTDVVTPSADPLHSSITKPPIPIECVDSSYSLLTHDESDQTERNEDESTFTKVSKQETESKAEDKSVKYPGDDNTVVDKSKKVKRSAQSESRAHPVTMETLEPAEANAVYAAVKKKVKKKDRPPPLPAPYQDEL